MFSGCLELSWMSSTGDFLSTVRRSFALFFLVGVDSSCDSRWICLRYAVSISLFDYLSSVVSYVVLGVAVFAGSYDDVDDLSSIISQVR